MYMSANITSSARCADAASAPLCALPPRCPLTPPLNSAMYDSFLELLRYVERTACHRSKPCRETLGREP